MSKKKLYIRNPGKQGSLGLYHYTKASEADINEAGYIKPVDLEHKQHLKKLIKTIIKQQNKNIEKHIMNAIDSFLVDYMQK